MSGLGLFAHFPSSMEGLEPDSIEIGLSTEAYDVANFIGNNVTSDYSMTMVNTTHLVVTFLNCGEGMDQKCQSRLPPEYTELSATAWIGIVTYLSVFVVSFVANFLEFVVVYRRLRQRVTPMNSLLMNLCIADILVVFFVAAVEVFWRIAIGWYAGDVFCKIVQFLRAFGLYLSSLVLICLSLDRYYAVVHPLKVVNASKRIKNMLICAWIGAGILSLPQMVVFGVRQHPVYPKFTQCTSLGETGEMVNTALSMCFMYFLPIFVVVFSYGNIIWRLANENTSSQQNGIGGPEMTLRRSDATLMDRAKIRTLKLTFFIVIVFIFCWTPYVVITLWHIIDRGSAEQLNPYLQEGLFIMVVANSSANPLVYGVFNSGKKPPPSSAHASTTVTMKSCNQMSRRVTSNSQNLTNATYHHHSSQTKCTTDV